MSQEKLMDIVQTAEYVGLSVFTVRRLAKINRLPAAKIGRAYRFNKEDIDNFIRSQYKGEVNASNQA